MSEPVVQTNAVSVSATEAVLSLAGEQRFTWNFDHRLDAQKRVQFPAVWRPADPATRFILILWPHPQLKGETEFGFIKGLTQRRFDRLVEQVANLGLGDTKAAALRRKLFHNSIDLDLDPAGRLCLPPKMASQIGLDKTVHFSGAGDHFELWDPETFKRCSRADDPIASEAYETLI